MKQNGPPITEYKEGERNEREQSTAYCLCVRAAFKIQIENKEQTNIESKQTKSKLTKKQVKRKQTESSHKKQLQINKASIKSEQGDQLISEA